VATERPNERRRRRNVFHLWVGLTIVFALALALVLPFIQGERFAYLSGVPVMGLNLVLLALGLGWLVWYVFGPSLRERWRQHGNGS
jgi:hypothetical protein